MSWKIVSLGSVTKMVTGKTPSTLISEYFNGDYLWVNPSDFGDKYIKSSKRTISEIAVKNKQCNLLPQGTVLLSCIGDIGKVGILSEQGSTNQQITGLIPSDRVCSEYLYYYILSKKAELGNLANKAVVAILNNERLKTFQIPLPPLPIQKRIAAILDAADALKRKDQELLKKYDELAQAIFIDMFGDPIRNEKGWEVMTIGSQMKSIRYGAGSPPIYCTEGIPFIRATNIKNGRIEERGMVYVDKNEAHKIKKCYLNEGDLLIVRSGANTGDCAYITDEYSHSLGGFDLIIEMENVKSRFYNFFINSIWGKAIVEKLSRRAGQPHLNSEQVSNIECILPPYLNLQKFKLIIDNIELTRRQIIKSSFKNNDLFNSLIQKAFKGELVA